MEANPQVDATVTVHKTGVTAKQLAGAGVVAGIAWALLNALIGWFGASQQHAQKADDANQEFIRTIVPANTVAMTKLEASLNVTNANAAAQVAAIQQQTAAINSLASEVKNATATQREAKGSVEKLTNELQQAKP